VLPAGDDAAAPHDRDGQRLALAPEHPLEVAGRLLPEAVAVLRFLRVLDRRQQLQARVDRVGCRDDRVIARIIYRARDAAGAVARHGELHGALDGGDHMMAGPTARHNAAAHA
jgi:hypothetical protein